MTANENSDDVSVLLGNGDGTFQPQIRFAAGTFPESLVAADFNRDDRADLAVANLDSNDISVLLGRGDGTFQDQLTNPVGDGPVDAVTADLNHDGHLDIITTNRYSNDISVLMGNGDGTFQAAESFAAGPGPMGLVVGDFNGDGRLDVAVVDSGNSDGGGQGVSILLGNGDGTFQAPVSYQAGAYPSSLVAGDFTGDGVLDLAVANLVSDDVTILIGDGHGGFDPEPSSIPIGDESGGPESIAAGDFTGDGVLDLAVANQNSDNVLPFSWATAEGRLPDRVAPDIAWRPDANTPAGGFAAGDFTGNSRVDLAVASAGSDGPDTVSILLGEGQGVFDLQPPLALGNRACIRPRSSTGPCSADGPLDSGGRRRRRFKTPDHGLVARR